MGKIRNEAIHERLVEFKNRERCSIAAIASAIGMHRSSVSTYLNDKYEGVIEDIESKIVSFLDLSEERANESIVFNYEIESECIKTNVFKSVIDTIRTVHIEKEIGVIYGEAGIGKTTAIKEYVKTEPNAILIEADHGYTARVIFGELHKRLGLGEPSYRLHEVTTSVIKKLKNSERILIIDEAEYLPYKALDMVRRIYDKAGIPVVLVGLPALISNLRGRCGEYQQLYSRVGIATSLSKLNSNDIFEFVSKKFNNPKANLLKDFCVYSKGNARHLTKLINRSSNLAKLNECELNQDILKAAAQVLVI